MKNILSKSSLSLSLSLSVNPKLAGKNRLSYGFINERSFVNLFDKHSSILRNCRTCSGNPDYRIKSGNDCGETGNLHLFNVIRGLRPANLNQRTKSGDETKGMQCGRSMIEMLGVLAIIGVLSVGGIAGYSKAMMKFKTNKVVDQVSTIVTNIKTLYAQQQDYEGLDGSSAAAMGAIPDEMGSSYSLNNPFGGETIIWNFGSVTAADYDKHNAIIIQYMGLPKEACIALATNDWGASSSSGLIAVAAAGDFSTAVGVDGAYMGCSGIKTKKFYSTFNYAVACPGGSEVSVPMPPEIAAGACNCDKGSTCNVTWKYY